MYHVATYGAIIDAYKKSSKDLYVFGRIGFGL